VCRVGTAHRPIMEYCGMSSHSIRLIVGLSALVPMLVTGLPAAPSAPVTSLGVPGRDNATPWIAADGSLVAVTWGASTGAHADVFVAVSRDGGITFDSPVRVNRENGEARLGGELPPRVAIVPRSVPRVTGDAAAARDILVLWTARGTSTALKLARSRDSGRTFDVPLTMQSPGAPGDRGWPALTADAQGTAHVLWLDHRGLAAEPRGSDHQAQAPHDGVAMARKSALYYAAAHPPASGTNPTVADRPDSLKPDTARDVVTEREITTGVCYCCKTAAAARPNGTLFTAWRQVYPGNIRDIAFSMSGDAGRSFSPPVRISRDDWAINGCPDDGPALAVDRAGTAHVVWPTVLGGQQPQGAIFYASTVDGRTFTPRVRIATLGGQKPEHPQIAIDDGQRVVAAWDELVNGTRIAAVREVKRGPSGAASLGPIVRLSGDGPASYPVVAPTIDGLLAVWTSGAPGTSVIGVQRLLLPARTP
jgi:hypothetical protein